MNLNKKIKGMAGVYFLTVTVLCSLLMMFVITTSRASVVISISDNITHIVATKVSIYSYNSNSESYSKNGKPIISYAGENYYPLEDFISMGNEYGFIIKSPEYCTVSWDAESRISKVQIGEFKTNFGIKIKPHLQTTVIEDY